MERAHLEMTRWLLDNGTQNINVKRGRKTALDLAIKGAHGDCRAVEGARRGRDHVAFKHLGDLPGSLRDRPPAQRHTGAGPSKRKGDRRVIGFRSRGIVLWLSLFLCSCHIVDHNENLSR